MDVRKRSVDPEDIILDEVNPLMWNLNTIGETGSKMVVIRGWGCGV